MDRVRVEPRLTGSHERGGRRPGRGRAGNWPRAALLLLATLLVAVGALVTPAQATRAAGETPIRMQVIEVDGWRTAVDTGIDLRAGDRLQVTWLGNSNNWVQVTSPLVTAWPFVYPKRYYPNGDGKLNCDQSFPAPCASKFSLVARTGGSAFYIGREYNTYPYVPPGGARLYLGVNDNKPNDNGGRWTVQVVIWRGAAAPA